MNKEEAKENLNVKIRISETHIRSYATIFPYTFMGIVKETEQKIKEEQEEN